MNLNKVVTNINLIFSSSFIVGKLIKGMNEGSLFIIPNRFQKKYFTSQSNLDNKRLFLFCH
jgi:CTP-dependent riboflavin kinase